MNEVKLLIHDEEDLYNQLDPEDRTLSDEVVSYVMRKYEEMGHSDKYRLQIISEVPLDQGRVIENFMAYLEHQQTIESREYRQLTIRQIKMVIIGVLFIVLWLMADGLTDLLFVEILSIIGSFAMWEDANNFIF